MNLYVPGRIGVKVNEAFPGLVELDGSEDHTLQMDLDAVNRDQPASRSLEEVRHFEPPVQGRPHS